MAPCCWKFCEGVAMRVLGLLRDNLDVLGCAEVFAGCCLRYSCGVLGVAEVSRCCLGCWGCCWRIRVLSVMLRGCCLKWVWEVLPGGCC
jgi:hypothetical protein